MADLRGEIAEAVRREVERLGTADVSKAALYRLFQDRGASRATVYRAIDDGLRLVAKGGGCRPMEGVPAPAPTADAGVSVTEMSGDVRSDASRLRAAIADIDQALSQVRHDATTIPAAMVAIRAALTMLHVPAGQSDQADRLVRGVIAGLRQGDATFGAQVAAILTQIGGHTT